MLNRINQKGFTVIELMIATSVFSVLLMIIMGGIIYIGRQYYKGISITRTSEVTRNAIESISQAAQLSGAKYTYIPSSAGWQGAHCFGNNKYSYKKLTQLKKESPGSQQSNEVFVVSKDESCDSASATAAPTTNFRQELLSESMRLVDISVNPDGNLFTIKLHIAYGGDASDPTVDNNTFVSTSYEACKNGTPGSQFCAVSVLSTTVLRKVR